MSLTNKPDIYLKNIIWTLSEDYSINIPEEDIILNRDLFDIFNLSRTLSKDSKLVFDYLIYLKDIDKDLMFLNLFYLCLEEFSKEELLTIRPSFEIIRNLHYKDLLKYYEGHRRYDLLDEVKYTRAKRFFNEVPMTSQMVKDLDQKIKSFSKLKNVYDLIDSFENLLDSNFFFSNSIKDKNDKKTRKTFDKDNIKEKKKAEKNVLDDYYGLIGSAEFTNDLNLEGLEKEEKDLIVKSESIDSKDKMLYMAQNLFGKNILSESEISLLEKEICNQNHKSNRLLISKGTYPDNLEANFRKSQLQESEDDNKYYLDRFRNLFSRSQNMMKKDLKNSLLINSEIQKNKSKSGLLSPAKIYRHTYLNDPVIFYKKTKFESSELSVDILLDGSSSQLDRKSRIASWTYTITQALTDLKIPTRVMTFSNLENVLGLTIFRDYSDSQDKNLDILKYSPAGSNRDGLAFRLVRKILRTNKYKNKILIYLTDGKPYDVRIRIDNNYKDDEKAYKDKFAEMDTAIEFRKLEDEGIYPLAIFTGKDEDLKSMQKIYGNNFAYIKDINRFSSLITQYIKRTLSNNL